MQVLFSVRGSHRRPLILGKGGFGRQLADWLEEDGWGSADFLDDNAPGCAGALRDYADPALLKPGRPAFVALGDNELRVALLQKLAAAGYETQRCCFGKPQRRTGTRLCGTAPGVCGGRCPSGRRMHRKRRRHCGP